MNEHVILLGVLTGTAAVGNFSMNLASRFIYKTYPLFPALVSSAVFGGVSFSVVNACNLLEEKVDDFSGTIKLISFISISILGTAIFTPYAVKALSNYSMSHCESGAYSAISMITLCAAFKFLIDD